VGKGTLVNHLLEQDPNLWLSRSWTTRPRRPHEPDDAYTFVDRPTFEAHAAAGGFVEWDEHLGNLYGTPKADPPPGRDVVLEIDVNGAEQVKRIHHDAVVVLVSPPSLEVLAARLGARGDDRQSVEVRLERAAMELDRGRVIADHVVVNDDLDRAVAEVAGIIRAHRHALRGST
jgi:guanylate kinase